MDDDEAACGAFSSSPQAGPPVRTLFPGFAPSGGVRRVTAVTLRLAFCTSVHRRGSWTKGAFAPAFKRGATGEESLDMPPTVAGLRALPRMDSCRQPQVRYRCWPSNPALA